jgi:opacity protein-like surface antigen
MRNPIALSMLALALVAGIAPSADAQRRGLVDVTPREGRHGFWINLGLGAGTETSKYSDQTSYTEGLTKPAFSLRLGGTVSPALRLGAELTGWADTRYDANDVRVTDYLGGLLLIGQFYPARNLGLFVKGGGGVSRIGSDVAGPFDSHENGFAWTVGAGWELQLSRSLFITPTIDFMQHASQVRDDAGNVLPTLYGRLATVGVALTLQPGR